MKGSGTAQGFDFWRVAMMKMDRPMQYLCAGVTLAVVGFGVALLSAAVLARGFQTSTWPTTSAQIVRADVETTKKASGFRRSGVSTFSNYYIAKIEYEYTIDGQKYTGDTVGGSSSEGFDPRVADAVVAKYPVGSQVTISYNPRRPKDALIDPTCSFGLWGAVVGLSLLVLSAGVVLWIKAIRMDDAQRAAERALTAPPAMPTAPRPLLGSDQQLGPRLAAPSVFQTVQFRMHWLLKTIAVVIGLIFFFFGGFALPLSVNLDMPAASEGHRAAGIIAHIIVVALTGSVLLFGAFLVWIGTKNSIRLISFRPARS
jgi:hypothetical protein